MIGKVPDQGKSFRGVVDYLLYGKKNEPAPERVAWTETRNLLVDQPAKAATLMRLTAQKSKRVKKPVYHYVISWRHDEQPADDLIRQVADTTCQDLGLEEYQRLYVAHRDTEHHHVHIVVNRVHPEKGTAWKNSHDYRRIECSLRRQAEAMGMDYVPGRHNDPERFRGRSRRPENRDEQRSRRLGVEALPRWDDATRAGTRDKLKDAFEQADNWAELERRLEEHSLRLTRKGQGLVIGDDTGTMKLSDLGKNIRFKAMEQRFGQSFDDHDAARQQTPRSAEFDQLADAGASAEMSYYLYRMGLASRDEVQRSMKARDRAREQVEKGKTFFEQINARAPDRTDTQEEAREPSAPPRKPDRTRKRGRGR